MPISSHRRVDFLHRDASLFEHDVLIPKLGLIMVNDSRELTPYRTHRTDGEIKMRLSPAKMAVLPQTNCSRTHVIMLNFIDFISEVM